MILKYVYRMNNILYLYSNILNFPFYLKWDITNIFMQRHNVLIVSHEIMSQTDKHSLQGQINPHIGVGDKFWYQFLSYKTHLDSEQTISILLITDRYRDVLFHGCISENMINYKILGIYLGFITLYRV